jgi:uroporphyrinogen decarboxylase
MGHHFPKNELIATMRCRRGALLPCKLDWPVHKICYWGGDPCDFRHGDHTRWTDNWGITWRKESPDPVMMPFPVAHPLQAGLDYLDRVPWPDPDDSRFFADLQNVRPNPEMLLMSRHPFAIYERAWLLVGMQPLLAAMADQPGRVDALFARIGAFEEGIARHYVRLGVEAAWICDDYGMNSAMMFSPDMWERFVRPHLQRVIRCYHDAGALVVLHSCGNITPLVDALMDVGIDVLDPLQPNCNRLDHVRRRTEGRMCLCGGVEASTLLAGDVVNTALRTHERISQLGASGGYIVGPDDEWEYPPATYEAMLKAVEMCRRRKTTVKE